MRFYIYLCNRKTVRVQCLGTDALSRHVCCGNIVLITKKSTIMKKYVCDVCGWVYDPEVGVPEAGIAPGTPFEELPEDFECPICSVGKSEFSVEE